MIRRGDIENLIEGLIALLDVLDGDPDLEDGHEAEYDPAEDGIADWDAMYLVQAPPT